MIYYDRFKFLKIEERRYNKSHYNFYYMYEMKNKHKLNLIPFIISIVIVMVAVAGIGIYSFKWATNHDRYLTHQYDNTDDRTTSQVVEEDIKWISDYYSYNPGTLMYRDVNTKKNYKETPFTTTDDGTIGVYYKNGVLHLESWFDLTLYSSIIYSSEKDEDGNEKGYVISYYFVFTNINNTRITDFDSANIGIIFVKGIGEGSLADEEYENSVSTGDAGLEEYIYDLSTSNAVGTNAYYLYYTGNSITYRVVDENAINASSETVSYVHRIIPQGGKDDKTFFNELEDITFAIYYEGETITELVEGTLTDLPTVEDYTSGKVGQVGYSEDFIKAPYINFIWPRLLLHCGITLVVTSIVACLFYFIWEPAEQETKKEIVKKKTNK